MDSKVQDPAAANISSPAAAKSGTLYYPTTDQLQATTIDASPTAANNARHIPVALASQALHAISSQHSCSKVATAIRQNKPVEVEVQHVVDGGQPCSVGRFWLRPYSAKWGYYVCKPAWRRLHGLYLTAWELQGLNQPDLDSDPGHAQDPEDSGHDGDEQQPGSSRAGGMPGRAAREEVAGCRSGLRLLMHASTNQPPATSAAMAKQPGDLSGRLGCSSRAGFGAAKRRKAAGVCSSSRDAISDGNSSGSGDDSTSDDEDKAHAMQRAAELRKFALVKPELLVEGSMDLGSPSTSKGNMDSDPGPSAADLGSGRTGATLQGSLSMSIGSSSRRQGDALLLCRSGLQNLGMHQSSHQQLHPAKFPQTLLGEAWPPGPNSSPASRSSSSGSSEDRSLSAASSSSLSGSSSSGRGSGDDEPSTSYGSGELDAGTSAAAAAARKRRRQGGPLKPMSPTFHKSPVSAQRQRLRSLTLLVTEAPSGLPPDLPKKWGCGAAARGRRRARARQPDHAGVQAGREGVRVKAEPLAAADGDPAEADVAGGSGRRKLLTFQVARRSGGGAASSRPNRGRPPSSASEGGSSSSSSSSSGSTSSVSSDSDSPGSSPIVARKRAARCKGKAKAGAGPTAAVHFGSNRRKALVRCGNMQCIPSKQLAALLPGGQLPPLPWEVRLQLEVDGKLLGGGAAVPAKLARQSTAAGGGHFIAGPRGVRGAGQVFSDVLGMHFVAWRFRAPNTLVFAVRSGSGDEGGSGSSGGGSGSGASDGEEG